MIEFIRKDRLLRGLAVAGLGLILIMMVLYISPIHKAVGDKFVTIIYDLLTVFFAGLAMFFMLLLWRSSERGEMLWYVWGLLALGMFLWTLGEVLWAYGEIIREDELPYPSVADIAWVIGYLPLFLGFFLRFRSLRTMPTQDEMMMGGLLFAAILIVAGAFVIGPIATENYGTHTEQFLNILYPVGDLALAFAVMLSMVVLVGGTLSYPWSLLAVGFLITSLGDLMYSYATWHDYYITGSQGTNLLTYLADVPYFSAYIVIAFAMIVQARLRKVV